MSRKTNNSIIMLTVLLAASLSAVAPVQAAPTCLGKRATIVGTSQGDTLRGTPGADVIVGLGGSDRINGRGGDDRICSGGGVDNILAGGGDDRIAAEGGLDFVEAGAGADNINLGGGAINFAGGGGGNDRIAGSGLLDFVFYDRAPGAVTVDLANGSATGHGNDTLKGIEGVFGSSFDDTITGDDGTNYLSGHEGSDTISSGGNAGNLDSPDSFAGEFDILQGDTGFDPSLQVGDDVLTGGSGFNIALYSGGASPVQVDLLLGAAGGQGNDDLSGIQAVVGTEFDDTLAGDLNANAFEGEGGNDEIDGRSGQDIAMFGGATEVAADLAMGSATAVYSGGPGTSSLADIEDLWGSQGPDSLSGDADPNELYGSGGADTIAGAAGDDLLDGEAGVADKLDGGDGFDTCLNGETVLNCEPQTSMSQEDVDLLGLRRAVERALRLWWTGYARR